MFEDTIVSNWMLPFLKPRFYEIMRRAKQHSMVSRKRMQNLWRLLHRVEREEIPGDFVGLGVARGGTAILIGGVASQSKLPREVWFYDAFEDASPDISHLRSADFQSAVSQGFQPASRLQMGTRPAFDTLPFGNRRHSRLETGATRPRPRSPTQPSVKYPG